MSSTQAESPRRSRTLSRVAAVQALFQCEQAGESPEAVIQQFLRHRLYDNETASFDEGQVPHADFDLFEAVVRGVTLDQDAVDQRLTDTLPETWRMERLDPVLRALLRSGVYELSTGVPAGVVINEYLDVAHGFFSGDETRMVNGVLDAVARKTSSAGEPATES